MPEKNTFNQSLWLKKKVFQVVGTLTRNRLINVNKIHIEGSKTLLDLPDDNVLMVVNHQTIFMDVVAIYHAIFATQSGQIDSVLKKGYLKNPKTNLYYIAARETMEKGLLPKILALAGSVSIDRTWRKGDQMVQRSVKPSDTRDIQKAIKDGWVITFPQGTTRKGATVRRGTAQLILEHSPTVIPVRVDGFREAFDKTGLKIKKKGVNLSLKFGKPIDYSKDDKETLSQKIADEIGEDYVSPRK